jgi:hypothetical protein
MALTRDLDASIRTRAKYDNFEHFFQDPVVRLTIHELTTGHHPTDLVSALLSEFTQSFPGQDIPDDSFIARPKEIVMIRLQRPPTYEKHSTERVEPTRFIYPPSLFIDPFLLENKDVTLGKRGEMKEIEAQIQTLQQRKQAITSFEVRVCASCCCQGLMLVSRTRTCSLTYALPSTITRILLMISVKPKGKEFYLPPLKNFVASCKSSRKS